MLRNLIILALAAVVLTLGYRVYFKKGPAQPPPAAPEQPPQAVPAKERPVPPPEPVPADHPKPEKPAPPPKAEFGSRVLRKGMKGDDVRVLQQRLRLAGFVHEKFQEGVFDEATEFALLDYQRGTPFLRQMYAFFGIPGDPKPYADAELCRRLFEVPGRGKALVKYKVGKGDTLWRIASRFGVGPDTLTTLNQLDDPSVLQPGHTIFVICNTDKAP